MKIQAALVLTLISLCEVESFAASRYRVVKGDISYCGDMASAASVLSPSTIQMASLAPDMVCKNPEHQPRLTVALEELKSDAPATRSKAARAIERLDCISPELVEVFVDALFKETDRGARGELLSVLNWKISLETMFGGYVDLSHSRIFNLIDQLLKEEGEISWLAALLYSKSGYISPAVHPSLMAAFDREKDAPEIARTTIADSLSRVADKDPRVRDFLSSKISDSDSFVRTIGYASRIRSSATTGERLKLIKDGLVDAAPAVRLQALRILDERRVEFSADEALPLLLIASKDESADLVNESLVALNLNYGKNPETQKALMSALDHADEKVWWRAVFSLISERPYDAEIAGKIRETFKVHPLNDGILKDDWNNYLARGKPPVPKKSPVAVKRPPAITPKR